MIIDAVKMRSARDRRAMTQEMLARQARVNVRTIQRAENGEPIRHDTLADIAAVLGLPPAGLVKGELEVEAANDVDGENETSQQQVLKRAESAEVVIGLLERSVMAVLDCKAAPTETNMPVLRTIIEEMEDLGGNPWDVERALPLRFKSLLGKLEKIAALNNALTALERAGLALYSAASTVFVKVPYYTDEGMVVTSRQRPKYVSAVRFVIAPYESERIRLSTDVVWPLDLELDDEVPF